MIKYKYGWECLHLAVNYLSKATNDETLDERVGAVVRFHLVHLEAERDLPKDMHECFNSFMKAYKEIPAEDAIECIIHMYVRVCHHRAPNAPEFNKFDFNT